MEELKKFARYFKPYKWHVILGVLFICFRWRSGFWFRISSGRRLRLLRAAYDNTVELTWQKSLFTRS